MKGIVTDEQSGNILMGVTLAAEGIQPLIASGTRNIYIRTFDLKTEQTGEINQIGFFPNINYQITF